MSLQFSLLPLTLSVLLMGCASYVPAKVMEDTPLQSDKMLLSSSTVSSSPEDLGQMLPISAQVNIADQQILLEVAQTPQQRQIGLMYRTSLAPNQGMLFPFEPAQPVGFWMKNVKIPLDMIFLRDGEVKAIASNVPPCVTPQCPTYNPQVPVDQVIELRGGRAAELGLEVGQKLSVQFLETETISPTPPSS
ncbi:DUF192 domain-containing protein [Lyngbya aestuarii]|uniref:DUF192 domain-containing protein n=1 Tax=Lyngbya aestuarii TaxID=118322 RepID=UPI00403D7F95